MPDNFPTWKDYISNTAGSPVTTADYESDEYAPARRRKMQLSLHGTLTAGSVQIHIKHIGMSAFELMEDSTLTTLPVDQFLEIPGPGILYKIVTSSDFVGSVSYYLGA